MLDAKELARRLRKAMDEAEPRVTSVALAKACSVTPQAVNGWRKNGRIHKRHLKTAARLTGRPLEYFLDADVSGVAQPSAAYSAPIEAKEEILLHLFAGLFSAQQREIMKEMRALFEANQVTRKELGQRALRGVSDAQIETAFGKVPPVGQKKRPSRPLHGESGTQRDDSRGEPE